MFVAAIVMLTALLLAGSGSATAPARGTRMQSSLPSTQPVAQQALGQPSADPAATPTPHPAVAVAGAGSPTQAQSALIIALLSAGVCLVGLSVWRYHSS
jgi:hypothetical protein